MKKHLFPYRWNLKNGYPAKGIKKNAFTVFGTFVCAGGSTMGYKLAGFEHIGGLEIGDKESELYKLNHNPKYYFQQDIREFNKRNDLPNELYNLDILDGSPPCSSFSMSGNREKDWGRKKKFTEGQTLQTLDDLVFSYCATIEKLKPKIAILENVKGIISGNAKLYCMEILKRLKASGYTTQIFQLNAATMGVPQMRVRIFFIARQSALKLQDIQLRFSEPAILFGEVANQTKNEEHKKLSAEYYKLWKKTKPGNSLAKVHPNGSRFSSFKLSPFNVCNTLTATAGTSNHYSLSDIPAYTNNSEWKLCGTFPMDYNFKQYNPKYFIGMSVPPVMTAQIANQIYIQWLSKKK